MIWVEFPDDDDDVAFDFESVAGIVQREMYPEYICNGWKEKCPDSEFLEYSHRNICNNPEHKRWKYRTEVIVSGYNKSLWINRSFSDVMLVVDAVKRELTTAVE